MESSFTDCTRVWNSDNRMGTNGAAAPFDALNAQLLRQGYLEHGSQSIDATQIPAPKQYVTREGRVLIDEKATPWDWGPAKQRQMETDATWTKEHGESYFGCKLSECQQRRNHRLARMCARVEHVFATIAQMVSKLIRTIGQARADFGRTTIVFCYNIRRLTYLKTAGIDAF